MGGHTGKHQGQLGGRGSEGSTWTRVSIVVSTGRNKLGSVGSFRIGLI